MFCRPLYENHDTIAAKWFDTYIMPLQATQSLDKAIRTADKLDHHPGPGPLRNWRK
jgi:hypothetical protein